MVKEWLTIKECFELPGFPGNMPAVRLCLGTYSEGKKGVKCKRVKSKAEEFHISVFLLHVRSYLNENEKTVVPKRNTMQEAKPKETWDMMFRPLTLQQREQVTGQFRAKGVDTVFPFLLAERSPS